MKVPKHKGPFKKNTKKKPKQRDFERGSIQELYLKKLFTFNGVPITKAIIEIDHINYGLDRKTFKLNKKKRSNFSIADIEKFLSRLDGEYLAYTKMNGRKLRYEMRIDSPIHGKNFGKTYLLVFETDYNSPNVIHTITLFPNW